MSTVEHYTQHADIPYLPDAHPRQILDLYIPKPGTATVTGDGLTSYPLIIYIHGGAFKMGDKVNRLLPIRFLDTERPQRLALASLNYRLSGDAVFPAAICDCNAAVRFLRANSARFDLDPTRFVVMGESAGAYMACMVGIPCGTTFTPEFEHPFPTSSSFSDNDHDNRHASHSHTLSDVAGVIAFYGPTDFLSMDRQAPSHAFFKHDAPDSPESLFLGRTITEVPDLVRRADPATYVGDNTPPVFLAHGTVDAIVPFEQSVLLEAKLRERKRDVTLHLVEGADHVWKGISAEQEHDLWRDVDGWLDRVVGRAL